MITVIKAFHLSWLKRLYDGNFHPWKLIPNFIFEKISQCSNSIFYPNLDINVDVLKKLPLFYKQLVIHWLDFSQSEPKNTSSVLSESVWNNSYIKIYFQSIQPSFFGISQHLFVKNLLNDDGDFLSWDIFRNKYNIHYNKHFQWIQLKNCIPKSWMKLVKINLTLQANLCDFKHHINLDSRIYHDMTK